MENNLLLADDFQAIATATDQPGVGDVMVGADLRLYRQTHGLLELIVPCEPRKKTKPGLWYKSVKREDYPPLSELVYLFDTFLSKYTREVMFVVGRRYDNNEFYYMVPAQVGTAGGIEWNDKKGMEWFSEVARFLGTVHVHPGFGASPSSTDVNHWKEKSCSGLHVIFGRNGSFTIHASVAGFVVKIEEGETDKVERAKVVLHTSQNLKLKKLLLKPPPVQIAKTTFRKTQRHLNFPTKAEAAAGFDWEKFLDQYQPTKVDAVTNVLEGVGAFTADPTEEDHTAISLRILRHKGRTWVMSEEQYLDYLQSIWARVGSMDHDFPLGKSTLILETEECR